MESNQLPVNVLKRIWKEAEKYTEEKVKAVNEEHFNVYNAYIAGATAENSRAQKLVDALEQVLALAPLWEYHPPVKPEHEGEAWAMSEMKSKVDNALTQWKEGKEVGNG